MKLIHSTGRELEVRDVSDVVFRLRAGAVPIKLNGWRIVEDAEARATIRELMATGLYEHSGQPMSRQDNAGGDDDSGHNERPDKASPGNSPQRRT